VKIVPDILCQELGEHASTLSLLELGEALQVVNMLKVSAADRRWDDLSRLLANGLRLLFLFGWKRLDFSHGLEELLAFINFEGSDGGLFLLGCLMDRGFSGSYVFCGGGCGLLNDFLLGGGVTLLEAVSGGEIGGDVFAVTVSLDHLGSFCCDQLDVGPITTL
jgi:hypothetical protein